MEFNKYKSVILPQATRDISQALEYIEKDLNNSLASKKLLKELMRIVDNICCFPYSMPKINNKEITLDKEYRYAMVNNFLLVYKVVDELKEIRIMSFLYAKSDLVAKLINVL